MEVTVPKPRPTLMGLAHTKRGGLRRQCRYEARQYVVGGTAEVRLVPPPDLFRTQLPRDPVVPSQVR